MSDKIRNIVILLFKLSCFFIVIQMIKVWVQKYLDDEDLCLVDYKPIKDEPEFMLPQVSMCFSNPFIEKQLNNFSTSTDEYVKYLKAEHFHENLSNVPYKNVTL